MLKFILDILISNIPPPSLLLLLGSLLLFLRCLGEELLLGGAELPALVVLLQTFDVGWVLVE